MPIFKGKEVKQCPPGLTGCNPEVNPSRYCMSQDECKRAKAVKSKTLNRTTPREKSEIEEQERRDRKEQTAKEAREKKRQNITEFLTRLRLGEIIDPASGEFVKKITSKNISSVLTALKKLKDTIGGDIDVINSVPGFSSLQEIFKLMDRVEGNQLISEVKKSEILTSVLDKYFESLGIEVEKDKNPVKTLLEKS